MKTKSIALVSILLGLASPLASAYQCNALCTQFERATCRGVSVERYVRSFDISGTSGVSKADAFAAMSQRCQALTPSGLGYSLDLNVYTARYCNADVIHNSTLSASVANSCL